MLTPYDEFPVHQHSRPFSVIPVTDMNWDDGYYFGVFNADERVFLYTGLRVAPNADTVGGYAGISVGGVQTTVRFSRIWRPDFETQVGPYRLQVLEPFRSLRLTLDANESGLSFDLIWKAIAPPFEEAHHVAELRERRTTDQTRYSQGGTAEGTIELRGTKYDVRPMEWFADRDHSWGLYEPRAPLGNPVKWLPPNDIPKQRMLRLWMTFQSPVFSGFYCFHEDGKGNQIALNDVFGTPFEGAVNRGLDGGTRTFVDGRHELRFKEGSRLLDSGTVVLIDQDGNEWHQEFEVAMPPWSTFPIGYYEGTWRDGGNIHTYHGDPHLEWDELDYSVQPTTHTTYDGRRFERNYGVEYLVRMKMRGPDGVEATGLAHVEFFMSRRYERYQPTDDGA